LEKSQRIKVGGMESLIWGIYLAEGISGRGNNIFRELIGHPRPMCLGSQWELLEIAPNFQKKMWHLNIVECFGAIGLIGHLIPSPPHLPALRKPCLFE
jgi:hypothetical protein